jgi:hypothetical protein
MYLVGHDHTLSVAVSSSVNVYAMPLQLKQQAHSQSHSEARTDNRRVHNNVHLPLVALHHHLHRLCPSLDHLVGCKRRR